MFHLSNTTTSAALTLREIGQNTEGRKLGQFIYCSIADPPPPSLPIGLYGISGIPKVKAWPCVLVLTHRWVSMYVGVLHFMGFAVACGIWFGVGERHYKDIYGLIKPAVYNVFIHYMIYVLWWQWQLTLPISTLIHDLTPPPHTHTPIASTLWPNFYSAYFHHKIFLCFKLI